MLSWGMLSKCCDLQLTGKLIKTVSTYCVPLNFLILLTSPNLLFFCYYRDHTCEHHSFGHWVWNLSFDPLCPIPSSQAPHYWCSLFHPSTIALVQTLGISFVDHYAIHLTRPPALILTFYQFTTHTLIMLIFQKQFHTVWIKFYHAHHFVHPIQFIVQCKHSNL